MPRKAAYLQFDDDPDAEFEFYLAEHLHKSVEEIRQMSYDEYMRWNVYLGRKAQMQELAQKGG